ncbi:penicillin-binding protein 2 [Pseudomonadota bacterium]
MARIALKDHFRETRLFTNRTIVAVVFILFVTLAIVVRMAYLQIISHEHYTTLSQNNRVSIVPVAPTRGLIFDRNGVVLAQNLPAYSLEIVQERVENMDQTLAELGEIIDISERDIQRFKKQLAEKRRFQPVALRFRLNDEEVARLAVNRHRFPGMEIQARLMREYPHSSLAVHAVGYVGRINKKELSHLDASDQAANYAATTHIGKLGVEKAYEDILHGTVGHQKIETNVLGRTIRVLERAAPIPGKDLVITLDAELQRVAKKALGENNGAVVAINPKNGDVLVLASKGDYDPNLFVNGIDHKSYQELQKSIRRPLFNRALKGQYPPGSTVKPFVGLAGLEYGDTFPDKKIFCQGWHSIKGDDHKYRDWKKTGHGKTDLKKAITESCDVFFYELAQRMGIDRIHEFLGPFGFGQRTGIDIAGEATGILPSTQWKKAVRGKPWYLGETLIAGIGQGYTLATPLQLAVATGTLSNRGRTLQPHLLSSVLGEDSYAYAPDRPTLTIEKQNPHNWSYIIDSMTNVIYGTHGTAKRLNKKQPYKIAGKTGTAQVFGIAQDAEYKKEDIAKHLQDHALFVAFAPADEPQIAVSVIVENGGSGGSVAGPIAGAVIDKYLGFSDGK